MPRTPEPSSTSKAAKSKSKSVHDASAMETALKLEESINQELKCGKLSAVELNARMTNGAAVAQSPLSEKYREPRDLKIDVLNGSVVIKGSKPIIESSPKGAKYSLLAVTRFASGNTVRIIKAHRPHFESVGSSCLIDCVEWYRKIKPAFSVDLAISPDDPTVVYARIRLCLTKAIQLATESVLPAVIAFYTAQQALSRPTADLYSISGLINLCDVVHCARTASFLMTVRTKSQEAAEAAETAILKNNVTMDAVKKVFDSGETDELPTLPNKDRQEDFIEALYMMSSAHEKCLIHACQMAANGKPTEA